MTANAIFDRIAEAFRSFPPILKDAMLSFARGQELDGETEPSELFERFATHHALRAIGLDDFDASKAVVGGENDTQIDAIAITVNGMPVYSIETLDRLAAAAVDGAPFELGFAFVQATMSYKFPTDKVALYILGVQNFFLDAPPLLLNEQVREALLLKQHAFAILDRLGLDSRIACDVLVVWPGTWTTDGHAEHATAVAEAGLKTLELARVAVTPRFHRIDGVALAKLAHAEQIENDSEIVVAGLVTLPPIPGVAYGAIGYVRALDLLAAVTDGALDDSRTRLLDSAFYGNIRAYLGADRGTPVNQRIAETLTQDDGARRAEFVLRNNGVTILARQAFATGERDARGERLQLIDFHIVNGSQTTHTLFNYRGQLDDSVMVPIKIVATSNAAIGRDVVLGANRQTPIDEIQILARNEFVGRIKRHLDLVRSTKTYWLGGKPAPLIMFERRSGEYRAVSQREARLRVVGLEELMQAYAAAFLDMPHRVHREGRTVLLKQIPETLFNDQHDISFYHCATLLLWRARQHFALLEVWNQYPAKYQLLFALRLLLEPFQCPPGRRDGEAHEYLKELRWRLLSDELWHVTGTSTLAGPKLTGSELAGSGLAGSGLVAKAIAVVEAAAAEVDRRRRHKRALDAGRDFDSSRPFTGVTADLAGLADTTKAVREAAGRESGSIELR